MLLIFASLAWFSQSVLCTSLPPDIWEFSGVEILASLRRRDFTMTEYLEAVIERRNQFEAHNFFIYETPDQKIFELGRHIEFLLENSPDECGELCGIGFAVKDNINSKGIPTTGGTPGLVDWVPQENAPTLQVLLQEDSILIGKANLHELAYGTSSKNDFFGYVRNPYNSTHIAGGSSGGSAAIVAARITPFALGTDTSCSVRNPCALSGCVGFRPTYGRYNTRSVIPVEISTDTVGPMGVSVEDVILLDRLLATTKTDGDLADNIEEFVSVPVSGPANVTSPTPAVPSLQEEALPPGIPHTLEGVRIGVPREHFFNRLHPEVSRLIEEALTTLSDAGAQVINVDIPNVDQLFSLAMNADFKIADYEITREISIYLYEHGSHKSMLDVINEVRNPALLNTFRNAISGDPEKFVTTKEYIDAVSRQRTQLRHQMEEYFQQNNLDVAVYPTVQEPAPTIKSAEELDQHNTVFAAGAYLPALSIPVGLTSDSELPVGMEFISASGNDELVLAIGNMYDKLRPRIRPPQVNE